PRGRCCLMLRVFGDWQLGVLTMLGTLCSACSIAGLDVPRSAPPGQPQPWRRTCKRAPALLVGDVALATSGALWATETISISEDLRKAENVAGWVMVGSFGASAIYGIYVAVECHSSTPQEEHQAEYP